MKKSIYKITGWSVFLSAAIIIGVSKNQGGGAIVSNVQSSVSVDANDEGSTTYNGDSYASSFSTNDASTSSINSQSAGMVPSSSISQNSTTEKAGIADMGITQFGQPEGSNEFSEANNNQFNQDAIAKGGPNNEGYNQSSTTSTSTNSGVSGINAPSSSIQSQASSPRVSAPTVVTAPSNPSGTSSGGTGGGDPFVPIDDYYGLIFLIAVSTVVGIFTIKKSRVI